MKFILLGAPGAGKGTQAQVICQKFSIPAISTGDLIRGAIKSGTETGKKAQKYVESGGLVPDDIVIAMLQERIAQPDCQNGYILDGFPRTRAQALALDEMGVAIDQVFDIDVDDSAILQRLGGRRVCRGCGATYHVENNKPQVEGVCDQCGDTLIIRKDDAPETIQERLKVYHDQTEPLKQHYQTVGKLVVISGDGTVEETSRLLLAALEA